MWEVMDRLNPHKAHSVSTCSPQRGPSLIQPTDERVSVRTEQSSLD